MFLLIYLILYIFRAAVLYIQAHFFTNYCTIVVLLHVSAELLTHHQGVILYRHKERAACHIMVKYTYITVVITDFLYFTYEYDKISMLIHKILSAYVYKGGLPDDG